MSRNEIGPDSSPSNEPPGPGFAVSARLTASASRPQPAAGLPVQQRFQRPGRPAELPDRPVERPGRPAEQPRPQPVQAGCYRRREPEAEAELRCPRIPASRRPLASARQQQRQEQVWCSSIGTPDEARVVLRRPRPALAVPHPRGQRKPNSIEVPVRLETGRAPGTYRGAAVVTVCGVRQAQVGWRFGNGRRSAAQPSEKARQ
jgi:hypothetical protein